MVAIAPTAMPDTGTLIAAIQAYLVQHPSAADSAEGVARWWLGSAGLVAGIAEVERALDLLVQQRRMRRVQLADGNTLYSGVDGGSGTPRWRM